MSAAQWDQLGLRAPFIGTSFRAESWWDPDLEHAPAAGEAPAVRAPSTLVVVVAALLAMPLAAIATRVPHEQVAAPDVLPPRHLVVATAQYQRPSAPIISAVPFAVAVAAEALPPRAVVADPSPVRPYVAAPVVSRVPREEAAVEVLVPRQTTVQLIHAAQTPVVALIGRVPLFFEAAAEPIPRSSLVIAAQPAPISLRLPIVTQPLREFVAAPEVRPLFSVVVVLPQPFAVAQSAIVSLVPREGDAVQPPAAEQAVGGGGWWPYWWRDEHERRQRERQRIEAAREEAEEIADRVDREIALIERDIESKEQRTAELARLKAAAEKYGREAAEDAYNDRVGAALERAVRQGNYSALDALDREMVRAQEEAEFFLLAVTLILSEE